MGGSYRGGLAATRLQLIMLSILLLCAQNKNTTGANNTSFVVYYYAFAHRAEALTLLLPIFWLPVPAKIFMSEKLSSNP